MAPNLRTCTLFALLGWPAAGPAVAQVGGVPEFRSGDPATLVCRVVGSKPGDFGMQMLTVEVRNPGAVAAEPLAFTLAQDGRKPEPPLVETFARAQLPHFARHGRPVPAGGKQTYIVVTALAAKKPIEVTVAAASFVEGGELAKPKLAFGRPEQVQRESMVGTFPVTQVAIGNPLAQDLDVMLLVKFEQPKDVTELVGVRLPANGTLDLVLASRPGRAVWIDPLSAAPATAVKATAFEVVDWCAVGTASAESQVAALRTAWQAWYRWPEAEVACAGEFTFHERRLQLNSTDRYDDHTVRGRFTIDRSGKLATEIRDGGGANPWLLLTEAFANVRRPDFDALAQKNQLVPVTEDRVALLGTGWGALAQDSGHVVAGTRKTDEVDDLQVRAGRIVSDGRGTGERSIWEWRDHDGEQVVSRRNVRNRDIRFAYATVGDRIVPTSVTERVQFGAQPASLAELTLSNLQFDGVVPIAPVPPRGDGKEALRALWDAAWRVPETPIVVEAKFAVQCGNDGMWQGTKKLSGAIVMRGIGRSMVGSDITFEAGFSREQEVQFAALLRDRLGIWIARDFNDRAAFERFFRGATIHAADAAGTFAVEGGQVAAVLTSGGLVRALRGHDGSTNTFTWTKVGARQVVTRIDQKVGGERTPAALRWDANVQLTWQEFGEHLLPTKMVFERIFGRDWGPESITFRDVRVRAP
ncbi:MAG: hypothetical protein JNK15_22580 [Planctomycetes bacterium]|nr:hypothetical protein [Planctomycetota bacterium]